MPLEHYRDFLNERALIPNDKMLHYQTSMHVTGVFNTVDDELYCNVEVHFSALSHLN